MGISINYVGANHQVTDSEGNVTENYREDGSIMFSNEASGYDRMVSNSTRNGNEEMGVITNNGVLVLPSYANEKGNAKFHEYGYKAQNGNVVDAISGKELNTVAMAHTHPNGSAPTGRHGDGSFMRDFPNKPMYVFQMEGANNVSSMSYIISNGESFNWNTGYTSSLSAVPNMTIPNVVRGNVSLRKYTQRNVARMINKIPGH